MAELRVMSVTNDGTRLMLKAADGTEYTLPIDDRLRAAVRGDRARLGQIDIETESQLRPRDIQARIRAGATAEEVARLAGIPIDRVRRFEGPVLAERAFMVERAQKTSLRRQGESQGPTLGTAVQEHLPLRSADLDSVEWDAWRRDDGTWAIVLTYRPQGSQDASRTASWTFDPPRRVVAAHDDEARVLIGEKPVRAEAPPPAPFVPRIARLPHEEDPREQAPYDADEVTSLLDAVSAKPGSGKRHTERAMRPETVPSLRPTERPETIPDLRSEEHVESAALPAAQSAAAGAGAAFDNALLSRAVSPHRDRMTGNTDRQAEADGVRPGRRATVPSWDEIVFGSRRKQRD